MRASARLAPECAVCSLVRMVRSLFPSVVLSVLAGCAACSNEDTAPSAAGQEAPPANEATAPERSLAAAQEKVAPVLDAYEALRASLAEGNVDRLFEQAATLESAASRAASDSPAGASTHFQDLATAAARLKEAPRGDVTEARRSFGEVSRHLLALTREVPSLDDGLDVYSCERAIGFQSWLQRGGEMRSPYTDDPCGAPAAP